MQNESLLMPEKRRKHEFGTAEEVVAGVLTVLVLANGVLSALTGSWLPTIAALALVVFAGWWCNR